MTKDNKGQQQMLKDGDSQTKDLATKNAFDSG